MNKYCITANSTVDNEHMNNARDDIWNAIRVYQVNSFGIHREAE